MRAHVKTIKLCTETKVYPYLVVGNLVLPLQYFAIEYCYIEFVVMQQLRGCRFISSYMYMLSGGGMYVRRVFRNEE